MATASLAHAQNSTVALEINTLNFASIMQWPEKSSQVISLLKYSFYHNLAVKAELEISIQSVIIHLCLGY